MVFHAHIPWSFPDVVTGLYDYWTQRPAERILWVATLDDDDETIVGCCALVRNSSDTAELTRVATNPDFCRCGVGRHMVSYANEHCRRIGYETLVLSTAHVQTEAHRMYESMGFQKVASKSIQLGIVGMYTYRLSLN